ncbi:hypothetical protein COT97_02385 [Candidatus Falkowbacteria bacterium CG10_big_fil_rev_8_21_14_0_10_39_11]|uniref:Glycosyl transferase family 3 domain-containing protein n=1 Tax=Candidatus Falkowbacteria bacterium CG10_big_fil_rev_8_21_14_0_10_39_11 TaxID=1974565 RepID=A0A2H0V5C7_9BACT|nr:MAG: hypothetical protein COT97_02385 [Candidatus Falkowbacteria bacterium CG10_big_fil_rev_8_21_14_0_10_39_11]
MSLDIKHVLKNHAYQNIPLRYEEAYQLGLYALKGCDGDLLAQIQSVAALSALHTYATYKWTWSKKAEELHGHRLPKNAAEQIAGVCAAIFEADIKMSEYGYLHPKVDFVMDNCGMGGDLIVTPNVSTLAALVASAAGIPMCKHGSPANADQGRYGSSDFVALICNINEYAQKREVEEMVERFGFGYTEALDTRYKKIHLQTHQIAELPHMNDIIGPITNPVDPRLMRRRVIGVNHLVNPGVVVEALMILNKRGITNFEHVMVIRGFVDNDHYRGMDELSICVGGTRVAELKDGQIHEYELRAQDFGLVPIPAESISPIGDKGQFSLAIIKGEVDGPVVDFVLANAALLFYLAGRSDDLAECYVMAKECYLSGKPYQNMLEVQKVIPKDVLRIVGS